MWLWLNYKKFSRCVPVLVKSWLCQTKRLRGRGRGGSWGTRPVGTKTRRTCWCSEAVQFPYLSANSQDNHYELWRLILEELNMCNAYSDWSQPMFNNGIVHFRLHSIWFLSTLPWKLVPLPDDVVFSCRSRKERKYELRNWQGTNGETDVDSYLLISVPLLKYDVLPSMAGSHNPSW